MLAAMKSLINTKKKPLRKQNENTKKWKIAKKKTRK